MVAEHHSKAEAATRKCSPQLGNDATHSPSLRLA